MDAFTGEIRIFGFTYPPQNWALCNGALIPVTQHSALYTIIGNLYGGVANQTFALPNLVGQALIGTSPAYALNAKGGAVSVPLTVAQMPQHDHVASASSTAATATNPTNLVLSPTPIKPYAAYNASTTPLVALSPASISVVGQGTPHENRQPYLPMNFCICLEGEYPMRP